MSVVHTADQIVITSAVDNGQLCKPCGYVNAGMLPWSSQMVWRWEIRVGQQAENWCVCIILAGRECDEFKQIVCAILTHCHTFVDTCCCDLVCVLSLCLFLLHLFDLVLFWRTFVASFFIVREQRWNYLSLLRRARLLGFLHQWVHSRECSLHLKGGP